MDLITTTTSAAALTSYAVAGFKFAFPSAPTWALALAAVVAGLLSTVLVSLSQGEALTVQSGATWAIQGLLAAAAAGGLTRTDYAAQKKRDQALFDSRLRASIAARTLDDAALPAPSEE